jgi:hypothetical protein
MTPPPPVPAAASSSAAPAPRRSFFGRLWSLLVFLIVVGAWAASAYLYRELRRERAARAQLAQLIADFDPRFERFKQAVRDVDRRLSSNVFQEVDLSAGGWQPIAGGFYLIDLSVSPQGDGVKIAGKVINPTSVTHDSAQLSARLNGHRATFGLAHVPPAVAQPFEVLIPGVAPGEAKRAYFALESSTISFSSSTTRKHSGGDPVDTDKALK